MKLEPLMTLNARIGETLQIGDGGRGDRAVGLITGGHFEGPGLEGEIHPSGADWLLRDGAGVGHIDVRLVLITRDGAHVYVTYQGVLEFNEAIGRAFAEGGGTEFGDAHFLTHVRFETGHADLAWLNHTLAVGEGRLRPGGVEYRIYRLVAGA